MLLIFIFIFFSKILYAGEIQTDILFSKQRALQKNMEVIANNVANSETVGFKEMKILNTTYQLRKSGENVVSYDNDISSYLNLSNGSLQNSNNLLDIAVQGEGYFVIRTKFGIRYTRSGNFTLNNEGNIVTLSGDYVLNAENEMITVPNDIKSIEIGSSGTVFADNNEIGKIAIAVFLQPHLLIPEGNGMFNNNGSEFEINPENGKYAVYQGFVEQSNVNKMHQMNQMLETQRDFTLVTGTIDLFSKTTENTINKLSKY